MTSTQLKPMFTNMNAEFGCTTQPLSMFTGINIEIGFDSQPKCPFNAVNIDFGWHIRPAHAGGTPQQVLPAGGGSNRCLPHTKHGERRLDVDEVRALAAAGSAVRVDLLACAGRPPPSAPRGAGTLA